jgi:nucleotidyltransferase/DNA polymerase involved in DNA repair
MRLLCLFLPRLPLQVVLRERPLLRGKPVILLSGHGDEAPVSASSPEASAEGVLPGMSAGQARQRCPRAIFLPDTAGECLDVLERLASILRVRATPLVALGGRDHLFMDLEGIAGDESSAAANLAALVRAWSGFEVRAGIAPTRAEALEAARPARGLPVVFPPGEQATEPPIEPFGPRELAATVHLPATRSELAFRAAIVRVLGALQPLLEGRRECFREVRLDVESPDGAVSVSARSPQPVHAALDALDLLSGRLASLTPAGPAMLRVTLARLGPDVRVRPCAATASRQSRTLVKAS